MGFGPVTIATAETLDISAPGAPGLAIQQNNNTVGSFTLTPPTTDSDGSPLTGLTFAQAVVIQASADEAEVYRADFEGAMAANGAQLFTMPLGNGEAVSQAFAIAQPGKPYSVLARCSDAAQQ